MQDNSLIVNPTSSELSKARCYTTLAILNSTKVCIVFYFVHYRKLHMFLIMVLLLLKFVLLYVF